MTHFVLGKVPDKDLLQLFEHESDTKTLTRVYYDPDTAEVADIELPAALKCSSCQHWIEFDVSSNPGTTRTKSSLDSSPFAAR